MVNNTLNTQIRLRPELKLGNKATIKISEKVQKQINFLHSYVGNFEWSGILLLDMDGDLSDISGIVANVREIFLCDIGTVAGTSYDNSDHLEALWDTFPDYDFENTSRWDGKKNIKGVKMAQVHTHHTLSGGAYFSNVDMGDLHENAHSHGLYISLILDVKGNYVCKGAFIAEIEDKFEISPVDFKDNKLVMSSKSEKLVTFDFDVVKDFDAEEVEDWFLERINKLEDIKKAEKAALLAARTSAASNNYHNRGAIGVHNGKKHKKGKLKGHSIPENAGFITEYIPGLGTVYTNNAGQQISDNGLPLTKDEQLTYDRWDVAENSH